MARKPHIEKADEWLERFARGKPCYLRLPEVCNHDRAKTALAHIRRGGTGGTGIKPVSVFAMPMCNQCHDEFDSRNPSRYSRDELDKEALRGLGQWLEYLVLNEHVIVVTAA